MAEIHAPLLSGGYGHCRSLFRHAERRLPEQKARVPQLSKFGDIGSAEVEGDGSAPVVTQDAGLGSRTTTSSAQGMGLSPFSRHEQPPVRPNGCTVRRPAGDASITERRSSGKRAALLSNVGSRNQWYERGGK